jgi:hypothetical protein
MDDRPAHALLFLMGMKRLTLILSTILLTACGATKEGPGGESELASRSGGSLSGKAVARCNLVTVSTANMEGIIQPFWTGSSYTYDRIQLKFTRIPTALTGTATTSMKVMRWGVTNGQQTSNGVPAPIRFVLLSNKVVINEAAPVLEVAQYTINNVISSYGLAQHGVTLQNFFTKVGILVDEVDMSYDALTFNFFDSSRSTSTPFASGNALIPAFHANPNHYAIQNPSLTLQVLHPHNANRTAGWSDAVYASYFESLCKM